MYFLKKTRQAFTLVELSVVIVIISIMLSTVLVSRSLISLAKVNKIQEEYRSFNAGINIFSNTYDCLPGDCPLTSIRDISTMSAYSSAMTLCLAGTATATSAYLVTGTGLVESAAKATCGMLELQATGYVTGINTANIAAASNLATTVLGTNSVVAKFSKQAMWDFRSVGSGGVAPAATAGGTVIWPAFASLAPIGWSGGIQLVLHSSADTAVEVTATSPSGVNTYTALSSVTGPSYAVPSSLASRLDLKFDDGSPYTGNIIGTRNIIDSNVTIATGAVSGSTASYACTTLMSGIKENTIPANTASAIAATYQNNNNLSFGCIVSYLITTA